MWMLDTALPFDAAVAALSEFAQRHFGGQKREAATKLPGVRSWAANWTLGGQEVSAQLTCADADSAGYLRNAYPYVVGLLAQPEPHVRAPAVDIADPARLA